MKNIVFLLSLIAMTITNAQENAGLPYAEIPKSEENYTASSSVGRMVDALGFRYYWASHALSAKDLAYKISADSRSCQETVSHIYELTVMTCRLLKIAGKPQKEIGKLSFKELRAQTLRNIEVISNAIKESQDLANFDQKKEGKVTLPFYHIINGPLADAIWHTGQLAVFRRASGNPINPKINHFAGTINP